MAFRASCLTYCPGGRIFTILREPTSRFISHYNYYIYPKGVRWSQFLYSADAYKAANRMAYDLVGLLVRREGHSL